MEKFISSSLSHLVPKSLASSKNQAKINENNLQFMLVKHCSISSSLNEDLEVIESISISSDKSESILSTEKDHQGQNLPFSDDGMNVQTKRISNTNLYNIGSMILPKVLNQKLFGKPKLTKMTSEKIITNSNTNDNSKPNYRRFKMEKSKPPKYCSYANVSMKSSFSKTSFNFPQNPNNGLMHQQNVDPIEASSAYKTSNDNLGHNNIDMTRKCKITTWQNPSNAFRQQRVKDWLKLNDRVQYDPPNNVPILLNLKKLTETTASKYVTENSANDSNEDFQDSFNYQRKTEVQVKKHRKPTISEICLRKCYELNKNYRISMKKSNIQNNKCNMNTQTRNNY